jgi:predicted PurR-regulated permease PerM
VTSPFKHTPRPIHVSQQKLSLCTQILALFALVAILMLGLLPALLSGLLVYHLVHASIPLLERIGIGAKFGKIISLFMIAVIVTSIIVLSLIGASSFFNGGSSGLVALLQRMADSIDTIRAHLPLWVQDYLPANVRDLQIAAASWLREHAVQLSHIGRTIGITLIYILTGMIIGGMVAFSQQQKALKPAPLTSLLIERIVLLNKAFRQIVFSQVKISSVNTLLTSIFLVGILPLFDIYLPLIKVMIAVTFIAGLLPVLGNLISNTVIFLVCLSVSPMAAIGALSFLVIIHKLEYFLNAHIIGTNIKAQAWEILLAMIVMEAAFGISGVIAAPIFYSYLKEELFAQKLI